MRAPSAEIFMACYRPGAIEGEDPRIAKAVRAAERDATLKTRLTQQRELDERCCQAIANTAMPPTLAGKIAALPAPEEQRGFQWRVGLKQPPILAACAALIFMLGWGVYFAINHFENFPGRDNVEHLVALNDETSTTGFEVKIAEVGNLEDWLFSRYQFEDFYVPPRFAKATTVGCRVFRPDNGTAPVAQFAIGKGQNVDKLFYMFKADNFGVKITPADEWRIITQEKWVAAVQQHEDKCFMLAFRGTKEQMEQALAAPPH